MNRKQIILIAASVLALVVVILVIWWVFQPASKTVQKEKPAYTMEASELVQEFETDEAMANSLYLDKIIQVGGTIDNISEDETILLVTLKDPGSLSGTICSFNKSTVLDKQFEVGSRIEIKGICDGYLMDVILTRCALIE